MSQKANVYRNFDADNAMETANGMSKSFDNPEYSDLTIICGESKFYVHRVVVCQHSGFFKRACDSAMLERRTGAIEIEDWEPEIIKGVLHCMYSKPYDLPSKEKSSSDEQPRQRRYGWSDDKIEDFYDDLDFYVQVHAASVQVNVSKAAKHSASCAIRMFESRYETKPDLERLERAVKGACELVPDDLDFLALEAMRDALARLCQHHILQKSATYRDEWRKTTRILIEKFPMFAKRMALRECDGPESGYYTEYYCPREDASCANFLNSSSAFYFSDKEEDRDSDGPWCPVHDANLWSRDYTVIRNRFLKQYRKVRENTSQGYISNDEYMDEES